MEEINLLAEKLCAEHKLSVSEYEFLIKNRTDYVTEFLRQKAVDIRKSFYGNSVYIRGLIEFTNRCKNDCYYCGLRKSNLNCDRYRLEEKQIVACTDEGYELGYRTFVLQGGEDPFFSDEVLCSIIRKIKQNHPDCAVTLSVGERSEESYRALFEAGADRYLLRHETADELHYSKLHPEGMSFKNRMNCLSVLRKTGFAVGAGFMVGSPFQTEKELSEDLKFIETFQPEMCGIGPFIPHRETPFAREKSGSAELTCFLLSVIRIIKPNILLPATTALATLIPDGRERGILSGANVVMPNLSPLAVRKKYELYNNKVCTGEESARCRVCADKRMQSIGYQIVVDRGDMKSF